MRLEFVADMAELINHQQSVVLVTLEADGRLRTAGVDHPFLDDQGSLWFFVPSKSPLVSHIEANPDVCVLCGPAAQDSLISLSGTGFVITHMAIKRKVLATMREMMLNGQGGDKVGTDPTSGAVVLVRVVIDHAEYRHNISDKPLRLMRSEPDQSMDYSSASLPTTVNTH